MLHNKLDGENIYMKTNGNNTKNVKKIGRPHKAPGQYHDKKIIICLTESEKEKWQQYAEKFEVPLSIMIRNTINQVVDQNINYFEIDVEENEDN